jgi:PAS domain S-box-containing protein
MAQSSKQVLERLWDDGNFVLSRWMLTGETSPVLALAPASEQPAPWIIARLEHIYALREELERTLAARPIRLLQQGGERALLFADPGGNLLARLVGQPWEFSEFLRVATGITAALRRVHGRGLIHGDVNPANILVDVSSGQAWFVGVSVVPRLRRGEAAAPPEEVTATLAYMAPEQTGRINRSVDVRSDLYSLGVTLYQMLTGTLPFTASDPMEWAHAHIARQPMPPAERVPGIPEQLSRIVMKLLDKTAEGRYQTAAGLETDLRACLAAWETKRRIESFRLRTQATSEPLLIPEKLYGREQESQELQAAFDRVVASGRPELVLVTGYSGIGKSSVVHGLCKRLVSRQAISAAGKFDQYKRDIPYATLAQALQSVIHQILSKSDAEVTSWQRTLREAMGPNGQLIVNLIPEVEFVIGKQPPIPNLAPQEAQARFQMVFRRFLAALARAEHPLILFLDDLQWVDKATLELLERLVLDSEIHHLMLIGAYRDNEVGPSHPLTHMLANIRSRQANVHEIVLRPLVFPDVAKLVADSLNCATDSAEPLAKLVYEKTGGNPFFTIQFFTSLAEERLLRFDPAHSAWTWDMSRIRTKEYTDNLGEFMAAKLHRLSSRSQEALGQFACLGNTAELSYLARVRGETENELHVSLEEAVRAGLVVHRENGYSFLHDRVQEAAYALIPKSERATVHLKIGRLLVSQTTAAEREEKIFEIVNQLNRGAALVESSEERERLAELNLIAGKRAKAATAYVSALAYLVAGRVLLADESWKQRYPLIFQLEFERSECEFLTGDFSAADERLLELARQAVGLVDRAAVVRLQIDLYASLDQSQRAVETGLEYLQGVGVPWSLHPVEEEVRQEYQRIWQQLGTRPIESLVDLPPMANAPSRAILDVLTALEEPAYFTDQNLRCLIVARMVNLSLEHGNSDGSCVAYVQLGWFVGPRFGDHEAAFRFGKLGLDLVEKHGLERFRARVSQCFGYFINPWTRHLRTSVELLRNSFSTAQDTGDMKYAVYACDRLTTVLLAAGEPLAEVQRQAESAIEFARRAKFGYIVDIIVGQLRFIRTLQGLTPSLSSFNDAEFDEGIFEERMEANPHSVFAVCWYWIRKLRARFYAGDYASALAAAAKAKPLLLPGVQHFEVAEYLFYAALTHAAAFDPASPDDNGQHQETLTALYQQLIALARNCPENFESCAVLVAAEIARIEDRALDAQNLFETAIQSAKEHGLVQNEAVAHETAARFYAGRGWQTAARGYLQEARNLYARWGALGKVKQLEQSYSGLREPHGLFGMSLEQVDVQALATASQAVSSELDVGKLVETLLVIALKDAGAQRGVLILLRGEEPQIEAEAITGPESVTVNRRQIAPTPGELPDSILRYVIRTQESIILDDASAPNQFSPDEYIRKHQARSVLCLPLVKQACLSGVLYLENNLASHVFTPERLSVLRVLVSQASISLEHARVVTELKHENNDRKKAEAALRSSEERWRRVFDNSSAGIQVVSDEGRIIAANLAWQKMLGYTEEELLSLTVFDITHEDDRVGTERWMAEFWGGKRRDWRLEKRYRRKDGNIIWADVSVGFVPAPEISAAAFITVIVDITERKRAEAELRQQVVSLREAQNELAHVTRVTTMGELAASIAHEVNQPLAGIVTNGNASLRWLSGPSPNLDEARDAIQRIIRDGSRAGQVVARIRALSQKTRASKELLDINEAIEEIVVLTGGELRRNQVVLRMALAADIPLIMGDRIQLQQVIMNLILNGVEAMRTVDERERNLLITTERGESGEIRVALQDTGVGLDPDTQEQIFDAFFTTKPAGLGMGLSISRSIVENHGGHLWAVPNEGPGATFQFTLQRR